jgi:magnesium-dependent phosphatase 1
LTLGKGVTFQFIRDKEGLTWETYQAGLDMWRRTKKIYSPYNGRDLSQYPNRKFIGYAGIDEKTIELHEAGKRRLDRIEDARWGFGMYVADDPRM